MATNPCVRTNCDLDDRLEGRKMAIIYEFIGLVLGVYGISLGIRIIAIMDHISKFSEEVPRGAVKGEQYTNKAESEFSEEVPKGDQGNERDAGSVVQGA